MLIQEVERVRSMLPLRDQARPTMSLRLADLLFDRMVEIHRNDPNSAEVPILRRRSLALYEEVLRGSSFHSAASGKLKTKIEFQLARLYQDEGEAKKALGLWQSLYLQQELPDIRREAVLRLAEHFEQDSSPQAKTIAEDHYRKAIELCPVGDTCHYPHYRLGWLFHRKGQHLQAVSEMKLSLIDAKAQIREEAVRDFLLFLSHVPGDGTAGLAEVEALSERFHRPELYKVLSDAYSAAGNKPAAILALEAAHERGKDVTVRVRILEEYYGQRRWQDFRALFDKISSEGLFGSSQEDEKILRRLAVQLDGERTTKPEHAEDFKKIALFYLKYFPSTEVRDRMMDGWIAAEQNDKVKIDQLALWIATAVERKDEKSEIHLREARASIAQKTKDLESVIHETRILSQRLPTPEAKRKYKYILGRTLYEAQNLDEALVLFQTLAEPSNSDETSVRSQNLVLDILNLKKDFPQLIATAEKFKMKQIADEARFEMAVAAGETSKEALESFLQFCELKKQLPKSCENAKVLAVKQRNQAALIALLKLTNDEKTLQNEYELSGRFYEAALLFEKNEDLSLIRNLLRLSLLFELAERKIDRDRILKRALDFKRLKPEPSAEEKMLLVQMLDDAGLMSEAYLALARIESGTNWAKLVITGAEKLAENQRSIHFHGKNSKFKFESRIAAVKKLSEFVDRYLEPASPETRIRLLEIAAEAYYGLATEILNSPIPANLEADVVAQLNESLRTMAEPFQAKAAQYAKLRGDITNVAFTDLKLVPVSDFKQRREASLRRLHEDPLDRIALLDLKELYLSQRQKRLALYFEGRLSQTNEGSK